MEAGEIRWTSFLYSYLRLISRSCAHSVVTFPAFLWSTPTPLIVALVISHFFMFVAPVSLALLLAQALVTGSAGPRPPWPSSECSSCCSPSCSSCSRSPGWSRGPGVLLVARLTGCHLPHHVPDVSILSTGFVSYLNVCKFEFLFGLVKVRKKVLTKLIICLDSMALFSSSG